MRQQNLEEVFQHHYQELLSFANASGALITTGKGAISSLPTKEEISHLLQSFEKRDKNKKLHLHTLR